MGTLEQDFMKALMIALGTRSDMRIWRQNTGSVEYAKKGRIVGVFHAGPPAGAADISGIVKPYGTRLEVETKGHRTEERDNQDTWMAMIENHGGIYVRCRFNKHMTMNENVSDAVLLIDQAIRSKHRLIP